MKASWVWWYIPVISALGSQRQENCKSEASLGYIVRPCIKKEEDVQAESK
jgi:hypothetical protein